MKLNFPRLNAPGLEAGLCFEVQRLRRTGLQTARKRRVNGLRTLTKYQPIPYFKVTPKQPTQIAHAPVNLRLVKYLLDSYGVLGIAAKFRYAFTWVPMFLAEGTAPKRPATNTRTLTKSS